MGGQGDKETADGVAEATHASKVDLGPAVPHWKVCAPYEGQPLPSSSQLRPSGNMANPLEPAPLYKTVQKTVCLFGIASF